MMKNRSCAGISGRLIARLCGAVLTVYGAVNITATIDASATEPHIKPPASIATAGTLVFCSDLTYPPEEFIDSGQQTGAEVEIGQAIAAEFGVKAEFDQTGFDAIIAALNSGRCDAVLSGMGITSDREKQVDFVKYSIAGQSIMIQASDKGTIKALKDLAGKTVAVQVGTTNLDYLQQKNKDFAAQGLKPILLQTFPQDADAANALRAAKVDAYFSDAPPVAYYVAHSNGALAVAGPQLEAVPWGIAISKKNPALRTAIQQAVDDLYASGAMLKILNKWGLQDTGLK
jgi:polar amino acid transport system substrate-binding protein